MYRMCLIVINNYTSVSLMSQVHVIPQLYSLLISYIYFIYKVHQAMVTIAAHHTKGNVVSVRMT